VPTTMPPREESRPWQVLRPLIVVLVVLTMSHPLGGAGLITLFPGWGVFGFRRAVQQPLLRRVAIFAALWSSATLLSAEVHHDKLVTQLGLYGIVVLFSVVAMWWLYEVVGLKRETVVILVSAGWLALNSSHGLIEDYSVNAWKYAIGVPISLLALGVGWRLRLPRLALVSLLCGISALSLMNDSRFLAGLSAAVALATLLHRSGNVTRASVGRQLATLALGIVAISAIYPPLAEKGYFGQRAQTQQTQINAQGVNFLFSNRPEMVQSAWIAAHHPLLGIGPGSRLTSVESNNSIKFLISLGLPMDVNRENYLLGNTASQNYAADGYASHSSAFDSVTHAGILAAPFWIFYVFLLTRMILTRSREYVHAIPVTLWLSLLGLWDVFFSPLSGTQWPEISLALFLAATSMTRVRPSSSKEDDELSGAPDGANGEFGQFARSGMSQIAKSPPPRARL
jgi:hypothetical protein